MSINRKITVQNLNLFQSVRNKRIIILISFRHFQTLRQKTFKICKSLDSYFKISRYCILESINSVLLISTIIVQNLQRSKIVTTINTNKNTNTHKKMTYVCKKRLAKRRNPIQSNLKNPICWLFFIFICNVNLYFIIIS